MDSEVNLEIPYQYSSGTVTLGNGNYLTIDDIEKGIQGCWTTTSLGNSDSFSFDHGKVTAENAAMALGGPLAGKRDAYYYYGPYTGTYTINFGGFDTDLHNDSCVFYNIINGEVVILSYDHVCRRIDKLPGEKGYRF